MPYRIGRMEDAPPPYRRLYEHIDRMLDGHDIGLVLTVVVNILAKIILFYLRDDLDAIDPMIDDIAKAMKAGCRNEVNRDRSETLP